MVRVRSLRVVEAAMVVVRACFTLVCLAGLAIIGGCAAGSQQVPEGPPSAGARIYVVALESGPLVVPAGFGGLFIISAGPPGIGVFNLLQLAAGMPDAIERSAKATKIVDAELRGASGWEPTRVIADQAAARLEAGGASVTVEPTLRPVPGMPRPPPEVHMMSNPWIRAVAAWHVDNAPVMDYAPLAADGVPTRVVEVAIRHYEVTSGQLMLGIDMKVVDAQTGRIVGRAFEYSLESLEPVKDNFANGALGYKELFAAQAKQLTNQCLADMGLVR